MTRAIRGVDLFCGAGGTSLGCVVAAKKLGRRLDLLAINHWDVAIATHEKNLPGVRHLCADVEAVRPSDVVPGHFLDLLVASPTCTHFSAARGGRPINDQKRADPWQVIRWATELRIDNLLIENVPEFRSWGPLDERGQPLKSRRGETFETYLNTLRGLGYTVEARVLNAADYGDPTTRRRLFIIARRGKPIRWPEPSHAKPGTMLPGQQAWRPARDIIDWSIKGESIFGRKRGPLAKNTIARIIAGLQRFGGPQLEPFLVVLRGTDPEQLRRSARPISLPLPAACASGTHMALAEPFLLSQASGGAPRRVNDPVPTVCTGGAIALVEPFMVPRYGERNGQKPRTHSLTEPMPTVPATNQHALVEPFLVHVNHGAKNGRGTNGSLPRPVSEPVPTVTASRRGLALIDAHVQKYYGTGIAKPVSEPVDTVTTKARFGLVTFEKDTTGLALDIRFRMLKPRELARAQGFPDAFEFTGNIEDQVRQIGNAVPRRLATALCAALLAD